MRKVLVVIIAILFAFCSCETDSKKAAALVTKYNVDLPVTIGDYTQIDAIEYDSHNDCAILRLEFSTPLKKDITENDKKKINDNILKVIYKGSVQIKNFLNDYSQIDDVKFAMYYYNHSNKLKDPYTDEHEIPCIKKEYTSGELREFIANADNATWAKVVLNMYIDGINSFGYEDGQILGRIDMSGFGSIKTEKVKLETKTIFVTCSINDDSSNTGLQYYPSTPQLGSNQRIANQIKEQLVKEYSGKHGADKFNLTFCDLCMQNELDIAYTLTFYNRKDYNFSVTHEELESLIKNRIQINKVSEF